MSFANEVLAYATEHYEEGGWDYVVECWSKKEIDETTKNCKTAEAAIKMIGKIAGARDSIRKDIQGESF